MRVRVNEDIDSLEFIVSVKYLLLIFFNIGDVFYVNIWLEYIFVNYLLFCIIMDRGWF